MKTTTFIKIFLISFLSFYSFQSRGQTYFYKESVENGTIWHNGAAEVSNPKSDAVNSSSTVLKNDGTGSWQETQFFPTGGYTIQTGDKFYISFYNPNGAAQWQLRMDLSTTGSFTQIGGSDHTHDAGAATGWVEVNLDLSSYVGESITKIQLYPVAGEAKSIYYDNIYVATSSGSGGGSTTQTYFYKESVENGTIWHNGAAEVSNPKSDTVNSSSTVIKNDGAGSWQETQFFPTGGYTIQAGDKFYISFYNPNGAAQWQLRMDLSTTGSFTQIGGSDHTHDAGAATGWVEVNLDLSSYVGESITKIQLYPAAGEAKSIYYDNVYIANNSALSNDNFELLLSNPVVFTNSNGNINYKNFPSNAIVKVFDSKGALIFSEKTTNNISTHKLTVKGLYFVVLQSENQVAKRKILFH